MFLAALATAAVLFAAAVAAALVPFIGQAVAAGLLVAAAAAAASAVFFLGQLNAAESDLGTKEGIANSARNAEAEARKLLTEKCPADLVNSCLARPAPC